MIALKHVVVLAGSMKGGFVHDKVSRRLQDALVGNGAHAARHDAPHGHVAAEGHAKNAAIVDALQPIRVFLQQPVHVLNQLTLGNAVGRPRSAQFPIPIEQVVTGEELQISSRRAGRRYRNVPGGTNATHQGGVGMARLQLLKKPFLKKKQKTSRSNLRKLALPLRLSKLAISTGERFSSLLCFAFIRKQLMSNKLSLT